MILYLVHSEKSIVILINCQTCKFNFSQIISSPKQTKKENGNEKGIKVSNKLYSSMFPVLKIGSEKVLLGYKSWRIGNKFGVLKKKHSDLLFIKKNKKI